MRQDRRRRTAVAIAMSLLGAAALRAAEPPDGAKLYQLNCQLCHGREGKATPGFAKKGVPDLNDPAWQKRRSDEEIRKIISNGSEGTLMKAFKQDLSPAQIDALVKHVRTLAPSQGAP